MDVEKWTKHFRRMAEGKLRKDPKGYYVVDQTGGTIKPEITVVSPVQQAVNLAKSELKEQKVNKGVTTALKPTTTIAKPKTHKGKSTKAKPVKPKKHKGRSTKAKPSQKKDIFS
jgi:hypothetical protein